VIVEKCKQNDKVKIMQAFKQWKRLEYSMVLEGLRMYSQTLERSGGSNQQNQWTYYDTDSSREY
jgi:hypothetical protein